MAGKKITLTPIAMVRPTQEFVYAPSRIRPTVEVEEGEYAAGPGPKILVSLAPDGKSDAVPTKTYVTGSADKGGNLIMKTSKLRPITALSRYIKK